MRARSFAKLCITATLAATPLAAWAVTPIFGPHSHDRTAAALQRYQAIAARGGWAALPGAVKELRQGATGPLVVQLHQRLAIDTDLDAARAASEQFDEATTAAIHKFQARHGLSLTGSIGALTLKALNAPVESRLRALAASVERLKSSGFNFGARYVVVNIPGAIAEAVENGEVARSHIAVVGKPERASPTLEARITAVNLNPIWTAPLSIAKADILPKAAQDPGFFAKHNMRLIGQAGAEIDPSTIDWTQTGAIPFAIRQDPGPANSLGQLRIDMPNAHAVYMHDTPRKGLFRSDLRFHSSGCARIQDVRDLAAWLLEGTGADRIAIETDIESGETKTIRLARPVPVAWVYLTAWGDGEGAVQFREDIYKLDGPGGGPPPPPRRAADPAAVSALPAKAKTGKPVVASALNIDER